MIKRTAEIAIAVLIAVNCFEVVFFLAAHRRAGLYSIGEQFPLPSGYLLSKRYMPSHAAPCYLIRVYARGCPYCRQDRALYGGLIERAQKVGCETIAIPPTVRVAESYNTGGVAQLQYVDMSFGRVLNPFLTPETILLDHSGRVTWAREGAMDNQSLERAIHALEKLRQGGVTCE